MSEVSKATLVLTGDTGRLKRALGSAKRKMRSVGTRVGRAAKRMSRVVVAAAGAAGAAMAAFAVKSLSAAAKFDAGMTKIETLVGLASERVRGMTDDVLGLAAATGQAPQRLTKALFRITSGGIRGAKVMESLRQAAEAAASGMGQVNEIARVATSSVEAFKNQGLDMSDALDTMLKTVREGNIQISGFQTALEQVQKQAALAGISFQELGGFLATASRTMQSRKAARGLRQFLLRLQDPTKDIAEAFRQAGTTVQEFRQEIRHRGLSRPLVELGRAADKSGVEMAKLFGRANAVAGMTSVLGDTSDDYLRIVGRVEDRQGAVNEAFDRTRETLANLVERVKSTWQTFKISFGEQLAPLASDLLESFRRNMPAIAEVTAEAFATVLDSAAGMIRTLMEMKRQLGGTWLGDMLGIDDDTVAALENTIERKVKPLLDDVDDASLASLRPRMAALGFRGVSDMSRADMRQRLEFMLEDLERDLREASGESLASGLADGLESTAERLRQQDFSGMLASGLERDAEKAGRKISEFMMRGIMGGPSPFGTLGQMFGRGGGGGPGRAFGPVPSAARNAMRRLQSSAPFGAGGSFQLTAVRRFEQTMDGMKDMLAESGKEGRNTTSVFRGLSDILARVAAFTDNLAGKLLNLANSILNAIDQIGSAQGTGGVLSGIATGLAGFLPFFQHGGRLGTNQLGIAGEAGLEVVKGPAEIQPIEGGAAGGVIDASNLTPMGQLAARLAMEDPTLQRLFTAGVDSARTRGAF